MDCVANGGAKIPVELVEKHDSNSQERIISWKGFYIDSHEICLFCTCVYLNVYVIVCNPPFEASQHRDNTLDDSRVFTYHMAHITGDAPSHCFAPLHSRFSWNSSESSQPLLARRNAQPLGRAFTLFRDDLAFVNIESRSQILFADNERDLILAAFFNMYYQL